MLNNDTKEKLEGKGGNITSVGWQVTLCDPIWHVSSRSGVATLRTLVTYLLTLESTDPRESEIRAPPQLTIALKLS